MTVSASTTAPKSVAALYALVQEQNAALVGALTQVTALVSDLGAMVGAMQGQYATPLAVVEASAPKGKGKKSGTKAAPAQAAAPKATDPEKAAAWALVKADREALRPLNKALSALGCKGDAWAGRFTDEVLLAQAYKALTAPERKAAKEAVARKIAKAAAK